MSRISLTLLLNAYGAGLTDSVAFIRRYPLGKHILDQIGHAATVAPFVVIPTDQFEKALVQFDARACVEDR